MPIGMAKAFNFYYAKWWYYKRHQVIWIRGGKYAISLINENNVDGSESTEKRALTESLQCCEGENC